MKFLSFASEVSELEEAINEIGQKYNEIYFYVKWTFRILIFTIIVTIIIIIIKLLIKWQRKLDNKEWPKENKKILKDEITTNQ